MNSTNTKYDKVIRSIFIYYDKDNDNNLTFNEFKTLCNDLGFDLYESQFKYVDNDENSQISYSDFKEWWLKDDKFKILSYDNFDKLNYAHDSYTKGLNEFKELTFDNFNKMINKYYNCSINENEFNIYNKNGDKCMQFNEFLNWLRWL